MSFCITVTAVQIVKDPRDGFYHYTSVQPILYTETERKDVQFTEELTAEKVTLGFEAFDKNLVMNLRMNRELLPKDFFVKYQDQNKEIFRPMEQSRGKHCHYQGHLEGFNNSWAAVSLCNGISGVFFDGEELHYIEPDPTTPNNKHFIFKESDAKPSALRCGVDSQADPTDVTSYLDNIQILEERSSNPKVPYRIDAEPRIVETIFIIANDLYTQRGQEVVSRAQQIANIINAVYVPQNIYVALMGVIIWDRRDEFEIKPSSDVALSDFLGYREKKFYKTHPNDNTMLFTAINFGVVVGVSYIGKICNIATSGEIITDHGDVVGMIAIIAAHELGHNFGMQHDDGSTCFCGNKKKCIMYPATSDPIPHEWSNCSLKYLRESFERKSDFCLKNKPKYIEGPVCGNGFVEEGEQCDCGPPEFCRNSCCNAATCKLQTGASCATGRCCDLRTCKVKTAGTMCRNRQSVCDLPEFCNGVAEFCPDDVYFQNGKECGRSRQAYCFNGKCTSHEDQCKELWGRTASKADYRCFKENTRGDRYFNCGVIDRANYTFTPCSSEDVFCGRLQCYDEHGNLTYGKSAEPDASSSEIDIDNKWYRCRQATMSLGEGLTDAGLTPNGAKCGDGKVCLNQKCVPVASIKSPDCPGGCYGNGVCNSKGHCHCYRGYAPPDCRSRGQGGSVDSGPAS